MIKVNFAGFNYLEDAVPKVLRPNGSGDYLLVYFLSSLLVSFPDDISVVDPGACILYTPGMLQDFNSFQDFRVSFVHFSADSDWMDSLNVPVNEVFYPKNGVEINEILSEIQNEYFTKNRFADEILDAKVRELLILISREETAEAFARETGRDLYDLFCQARFTMLSNCESEWSSTNMCEMVSLSRSQFYKYYLEFFGVPPMSDLNEARIEKAKNLLLNRNLQVSDVARMCGYASIHHFSRTFKAHTGVSPLNYLKENDL